MNRMSRLAFGGLLLIACAVYPVRAQDARIDRLALVTRHDPVLRTFDVESPLSVGNGRVAFTVDATGLQTL